MTWLGIDAGTTNLKACLIPGGRTLTARTPSGARELQEDVLGLIAKLTDRRSGVGVGITGMAVTGPGLDSRQVAVDPALAMAWDSHFWHRFHKLVAGPPPT